MLKSFDETTETSALEKPIKDENGVLCAIVKVGIIAENPRFEGVKQFEKKDGEYWVYVADSFEQFMVKTDNFVPFICKFSPVKSGFTYRAIIVPTSGGDAPASSGGDVVVSIPGTSHKITLVEVKPGMFDMGATEEQKSKEGDEKPVHNVRITKPYYMATTEVTQAVWEAVMGNNPSVFVDPSKPVENVSWVDAQEFIAKLSESTGKNFKLPTEAQWEYAARGGHKSALNRYSGSSNSAEVGWGKGNSMNRTHEVGKLQPNELGIYDMSGNVWELCRDTKKEYPKGAVTDPEIVSGGDKVKRGGAWNCEEEQLRNAYRRRSPENAASPDTGLRLVIE